MQRTTKNKAHKAPPFKVVNVKVSEPIWDDLRAVALRRKEPVWQIVGQAINRYLTQCARARAR